MVKVITYLQDGRTFTYGVKDATKAREHAHRIINYGFRNIEGEEFTYYPVHQILKVKFQMKKKDKLATEYVAR